jgi:hypothetical protein
MKFETTIRLVTDAKDKAEALEIAGEYLSGNLTTGVDMKYRTTSIRKQVTIAVVAASLVVAFLAINLTSVKTSASFVSNLPGDSVIQPPLKTAPLDKKLFDFKREWQTRHAQEAISSTGR